MLKVGANCEVNINNDDTREKIKNRTTKDMDCADECRAKHDSGAKRDKCIDKCNDLFSFN